MSDYLDRYGRAQSVCHRLPPRLKIFLSIAAIAIGMAIPPAHWPAHGALLCVLFASLSLARAIRSAAPSRFATQRSSISSSSLAGLKYGKCALDSVNKAIELDPKSSMAYLSHGVGNYYLPQAFGGGIDLAIKDFRKAIELNPKNADAWLWLGVALRRSNEPAEAQKAFEKSLEINPNRVWAHQQLEKTPGS